MTLQVNGTPRPDHGPGWIDRVCATCSASWVGELEAGTWCPWCERREAALLEETRHRLLHPRHLESSAGNPRYDALDPVGRAVWDRTRGQIRGTDSVLSWVARLGRAVEVELVTEAEAEAALRRVTRSRAS